MTEKLLETKKNAIGRLEKSKLFQNQNILIKILYYLLEAERKGKNPKSTTIALDILGEEESLQVSLDSYARTQIHTLRKKLELYYLSEGKEEHIKLSIPKGKYRLVAEEVAVSKNKLLPQAKKIIFTLSLIVFISLLFNVYFMLFSNKSTPAKITSEIEQKKEPKIFEPLFSNGKQINIVIGAKFLYREYDPQLARFRYVQDLDSIDDYNKSVISLSRRFPEREITMTKRSVFDPKLYNFVEKFKDEFPHKNVNKGIKLATYFSYKDTDNLIFVGNLDPVNMGKFLTYFNQSSFEAKLTDPKIGAIALVLNRDGKKEVYERMGGHEKKRKTYYLIFKTKRKDNHLLYLVHLAGLSRYYVNDRIFNVSFSEEIVAQFGGKLPDKYELLIEVEGQHMGLSHKIIYAKKLD